jgi:hypothetical protein
MLQNGSYVPGADIGESLLYGSVISKVGRSMSITELGSLGEFVGSLAVLATLAYLAVQVRQTKRAFQSASLQNGIATMNQNTQNIAADPEYTEIVMRGFYEHESLNPTQRFRFGLWLTSMFHVFQQHYFDAEKGLGDPRIWAGEQRAMTDLLGTPGVVKWWREFVAIPYSDVFIEHVNTILGSAQETEQFRKLRESQAEST